MFTPIDLYRTFQMPTATLTPWIIPTQTETVTGDIGITAKNAASVPSRSTDTPERMNVTNQATDGKSEQQYIYGMTKGEFAGLLVGSIAGFLAFIGVAITCIAYRRPRGAKVMDSPLSAATHQFPPPSPQDQVRTGSLP